MLVQELWPYEQASVWHTSRSYRAVLRECYLCALPLIHYKLPVSLRRELIHSSGATIFVTATQGTPPDRSVAMQVVVITAPAGRLLSLPEGSHTRREPHKPTSLQDDLEPGGRGAQPPRPPVPAPQ